ncbi:MAG TPA: nuclear transport factor 2 family protein [Steroidobacteraceae bacterium]|nr:nuclear transport factor 2 family protein [Steroidobacteraceae bacterium]
MTGELAQRFVVALDSLERHGGDVALEEMVQLFSPMARLISSRSSSELTGTHGARRYWSKHRTTFPTARTEIYEVTTNDRCAGLFWTTHVTPSEGQPLDYDGATLLAFEDDGLIIELRSVMQRHGREGSKQ